MSKRHSQRAKRTLPKLMLLIRMDGTASVNGTEYQNRVEAMKANAGKVYTIHDEREATHLGGAPSQFASFQYNGGGSKVDWSLRR